MSWFESIKSGVKSFLTLEPNPYKVTLVNTKGYNLKRTHKNCREDCLVMYAPASSSDKYEIILQIPCDETLDEALSLCRLAEQDVAETQFLLYKDKIPVLVSKNKELASATAEIQALCDSIREHPNWSLAHLAVSLNLVECLSHPAVIIHINDEDVRDGTSPLQLAIQCSNVEAVQELLKYDVDITHLDTSLNSLLHIAANSNRKIVTLLCERSKGTINSRNSVGHTPLHVACLADKPDCVEALLEAGADVNIEATQRNLSQNTPGLVGSFMKEFHNQVHLQDMKFGGTPLHWACSPKVIDTLVERGVNINGLNFDQKTALHIMVMRNRFECVLTLLARSADPNIGDKDGNTPLHIAVKEGKEIVVKTLLIFGADTNYKNHSGVMPRHGIVCDNSDGDKILNLLHSVGAPRCPANQTGCNLGCKFDGTYDGIIPIPPITAPCRDIFNQMMYNAGHKQALKLTSMYGKGSVKGGRLLCLDGGGIRGIILVVILMDIEKYLPNNKRITDCFDWIAGTSTGGIVALGLGFGKSLHELLCMYLTMKNLVFAGRRPYDSSLLENVLRDTFGTETKMTDIKHPKIIVTGSLSNRQPIELHMFRNYESPNTIIDLPCSSVFPEPPLPEEQHVWAAARATGAAPTYFKAHGNFLDGGLIANNPTMDAMTEIHEYNLALQAVGRDGGHPLSVVVSAGTGLMPVEEIIKNVDVFLPERIWDAGKFVLGVSALGKMLVDQATQADGRVVDRTRAWCSMIGVPYFRFSPQLFQEVEMDEKKNDIIVNMMFETKAYMYSVRMDVQELVKILLSDD